MKKNKLSMRKKAQEVEYILKAFEELHFELTDPDDMEVFINGLAFKSELSSHLLNKVILNNMGKFSRSFIENWKIYFAEEYSLSYSFSKEQATKVLNEILYAPEELTETEEEKELEEKIKENEKQQIEKMWEIHKLKKEPISTETVPDILYPEYSTLLSKYNSDEIWDIASGKKTDVTSEEISQAKEVIQRGIVANRLSMRKTAQSTSETIQKAQQGDENAIAKVIEENEGLIASALIKWGLTPGSDDFQDTMSDIKVEMLNRIIPQYNSSKGAFSTFLTTAVYNFLRRGTRKKEYEEKQKEVSTEEPTGEDITLGESLEDKSHPLVQMTISSARENLQSYLHTKNPELEDIILRIFDLKIEDNSHEQIAEFLNKEGFKSKGKLITRFIVNNLVNEWIKPALAQFFEAFKTAKLGMRKFTDHEIAENLQKAKIGELVKVSFPPKGAPAGESMWVIITAIKNRSPFRAIGVIDNAPIMVDYVEFGDEVEFEASDPKYPEWLEFIRVTRKSEHTEEEKEKVLQWEKRERKLTEKEKEEIYKKKLKPEISVIEQELSTETIPVPSYVEVLQKYTEDEIWDIVSGKKTDVSSEEIEQAKEVISRGIIANRLSMRKEGSRE